jgi:tetratricopeptide (TPR) repeat protein
MSIFHRLFVEPDDTYRPDLESIEDVFAKVQKIFETYNLDSIYYHLNLVFEFLRLEYYTHYKVYRESEKYFEEVNDAATNLLVNYPTYTFPAQFLITKIQRHLRLGNEADLYAENENLFLDFEVDPMDVPKHTIYTTYRAMACYYAGKYDEAAKILNNLLNEVSLKKYAITFMEVKALLSLQYVMLQDYELFNQISNSIQRQIRLLGKDSCENILLFLKVLKITTSEAKKEKAKKISALLPRLKTLEVKYFAPTLLIRFDEKFVKQLTDIEPVNN